MTTLPTSIPTQFAVYGCGAYGTDTYQSAQCVQITAPNTGYAPAEKSIVHTDAFVLSIIGGVLMLVAVVTLVLLRRHR